MTRYICFFLTAIGILPISSHNSFRVLFDKIASYILFEKCIDILELEMASPGNQHCANCIGTLSFPLAVARCAIPKSNCICSLLCQVYTARVGSTKLSCHVRGVNWTLQSVFVLSSLLFVSYLLISYFYGNSSQKTDKTIYEVSLSFLSE